MFWIKNYNAHKWQIRIRPELDNGCFCYIIKCIQWQLFALSRCDADLECTLPRKRLIHTHLAQDSCGIDLKLKCVCEKDLLEDDSFKFSWWPRASNDIAYLAWVSWFNCQLLMLPSRQNCLIYTSALTNKSLVARIWGVSTGSLSDCSGEVDQEIKSAWVIMGLL